MGSQMRTPLARVTAVAVASVLALSVAGCGSKKSSPDASASGSPDASPSVAPYIDVPGDVQLTPPGTKLKLGQDAVIAWHPRQDTVAALDVTVTRIERTTYDKSFQGWNVGSKLAATTPYFARAVVKNVSGTDLGPIPVPLWGQQDNGTLVGTLPFDKRTFAPCHPAKLPKTFKPGAKTDLCFVFTISPGQDLASVTFQPLDSAGQQLQGITWKGKVQTKVKPPAPPKKTSKKSKSKSSKAGKSGKSSGKSSSTASSSPSQKASP